MATKKTIELEAKTNAQDVQKQFEGLRNSIKETKEQIDLLDKSSSDYERNLEALTQQLNDTEQEYKELSKSSTDLGASFEDLNGEMKPLTARMGEMEDRLYEMALAGDTASREYKDLLTEVGRYRKVQMDTDMVVDAAATTMAQKLGGALQGAASGFAMVQGAMGLMGTESEELEKTLLKVQSAMAIAQGVQGVREGVKAFKAMGMAAKVALGGIRKGLIATGIGAAVVALGFIVAYWEDIVKYTNELLGKTDSLNEKYEEGEKILATQKKTTERKIRLMEAEGATAEEIHKVKLAMLDAEIAQSKISVQRAEAQKKTDIEASKRHKAILQGILSWMFGPVDALIGVYNVVADKIPGMSRLNRLSEIVANAVFNVDVASDKADEAIREANENLTALMDERKILTATFNKQQVASATSSRQRAKARKDALLAIEREIEDKRTAIRKESEMKDILLAERTQEREKEDLDIRLRDKKISDDQYAELKKISEGKLKKALRDIDYKYRAEELEAERQRLQNLKDIQNEFLNELEAETDIANKRLIGEQAFEIQLVEDKYFRLIEMAKQYGLDTEELEANRTAALKEINDKYTDGVIANNDKQKADDFALYNAKFDIAHQSLGAINDLVQALAADNEKSARTAFNINKAVGIAQAVMSTAQGIMNAYASPVDVASGIAFAKSAIIATTGAAQIATIAKQQFQTGGGGSGSVDAPQSDTGSSQAPSFNVVGDTGMNQLASLQMQPTQAFVVSGDITTAQSLDRNKIQNATI